MNIFVIFIQEKRVFAAGADWCADILDVFVRVDESVAVGDVVSRSYTPATLGQATVVLHLYATHDHKPMVGIGPIYFYHLKYNFARKILIT